MKWVKFGGKWKNLDQIQTIYVSNFYHGTEYEKDYRILCIYNGSEEEKFFSARKFETFEDASNVLDKFMETYGNE